MSRTFPLVVSSRPCWVAAPTHFAQLGEVCSSRVAWTIRCATYAILRFAPPPKTQWKRSKHATTPSLLASQKVNNDDNGKARFEIIEEISE